MVYFSYVQTAFWDVMPPGLHIIDFTHSKDLRASKPGKKKPNCYSKKTLEGWKKEDAKWRNFAHQNSQKYHSSLMNWTA